MKKDYLSLFRELVPNEFSNAQKDDFLEFCKEYCAILSKTPSTFQQDNYFYFVKERENDIALEVFEFQNEADSEYLETRIFKNVLELFNFLELQSTPSMF